jgi:hypothetical protein
MPWLGGFWYGNGRNHSDDRHTLTATLMADRERLQ